MGAGAPEPVVNFLRGGQLGVSFFFILSGFILTYTYSRTRWDQRTLTDFGVGRVARIVPVYYLSLLIALPLFLPSASLEWAAGSLLLVQSWLPTAMFGGTPWNGLAWSLSVEALFYLLFPALVLVTRRLGPKALGVALVVTWMLMVGLRLPRTFPEPGVIEFVHPALELVPFALLRVPEFISGMLLAHLYFCRAWRFGNGVLLGTAAATVVVLAATDNEFVRASAAVLFGLVIFVAASSEGSVTRLLGSRAFVLLGGASYGIYIFQGAIYAWLDRLFDGGLVGDLLVWPTVIGFSVLVFQKYEEPLRRQIRSAYRKRH